MNKERVDILVNKYKMVEINKLYEFDNSSVIFEYMRLEYGLYGWEELVEND